MCTVRFWPCGGVGGGGEGREERRGFFSRKGTPKYTSYIPLLTLMGPLIRCPSLTPRLSPLHATKAGLGYIRVSVLG